MKCLQHKFYFDLFLNYLTMNNIKTIEIKSQIAKSYLVNICLFSVFIYVGEEKLNKSTLKIQTF